MVSPRKSRRKSACFSRTRTSIPARASRYPNIIPAGTPPAIQPVSRDADIHWPHKKGWRRSLPPYDPGDYDARVGLDGLELFPVVVDLKEQISCNAYRGNVGREGAGAVR